MNKSIVTYAVIGAVLMGLLASGGKKRGKKMGAAVKGAAYGAVLAWIAPRFGVRLPGTTTAAASQMAGLPGGPPP